MKEGKSLSQLAVELERQYKTKRDFVADTRQLEIAPDFPVDTLPGLNVLNSRSVDVMRVNGHGSFVVTDHTHGQIANRLGVPKPYYDRMRSEAPDLLKSNIQHWFNHKPERRMVRVLDGNARAFLSDRYRLLDNFDLAQAVLPIFGELGEGAIKIESCEITDARMYIKAVFPKIETEIKKGDVVQSGIVITNSEVGMGALKVEPMVFRLVCTNGLIVPDYAQRRAHLGRGYDDTESAYELFRDETLMADDKAFWMKVQDVVRASLKSVQFEKIVDTMRAASDRTISRSPVDVVELVSDKYQLNKTEKDNVLLHLIQGGDLSQWGVVNAITRTAQDVESYDRSTDMERLGGQVLLMQPRDWDALAKAA
jgi:hypothetical protein